MAPFYGCRDPGTKLDGVKLAPVTAKTSKTGPRHVVRHTITIAPGDDGTPHTATFIGPIHGLGDTNMGWAQQAMMLHQQLPWVKFVLPNAPTSPVTLNGGMAMPSWYDITDLTDRAGQECTGIDESRAEIIELIEEAKAEGIPASRIVVGGFSQGGAMAAQVADDLGARWALLFSPVYAPGHPARCSCPTLLVRDPMDEVDRATCRLVSELPPASLRQLEHAEGHRLPAAGKWWSAVANFLEEHH